VRITHITVRGGTQEGSVANEERERRIPAGFKHSAVCVDAKRLLQISAWSHIFCSELALGILQHFTVNRPLGASPQFASIGGMAASQPDQAPHRRAALLTRHSASGKVLDCSDSGVRVETAEQIQIGSYVTRDALELNGPSG
jgi:hypothetical protein